MRVFTHGLAVVTMVAWALLCLFRLAIYRRLPVAPGDAYGVGDVIEMYWFGVDGALSFLTIVVAVVAWKNRRLATDKVAGYVSAMVLLPMIFSQLPRF